MWECDLSDSDHGTVAVVNCVVVGWVESFGNC